MSELFIYLKPLVLTIIFEWLAAAVFFRMKDGKEYLLVLLVNVMTNPLLVYISLHLMYHLGTGTGQLLTYLVLEPLVILSEYLLYREYMPGHYSCLKLSFILNIVSIIGGLICQRIM